MRFLWSHSQLRALAWLRIGLVATLLGALALAPAPALAQFALGLQDPGFSFSATSAQSRIAYDALDTVRGSTIRITVSWNSVAPAGKQMPSGFEPSNPGDPGYNWSSIDTAVRSAAAHHDRVLLTLTGAPQWAQPPGKPASLSGFNGAWNPNATQFGAFAHAAALRYSGHFADPLLPGSTLPRVTLWEVWNEENLPEDLTSSDPVNEYRSLLDAGYHAIKEVNRASTVAVGGLAPVSFIPGISISPLKFAAQLMCLRRVGTRFVRASTCAGRAEFDVLAMHPYSLYSTPTLHAYNYDDVLIADMGKLTTLLHAAEKLHTASPAINYGLWVTEWSWFTNPPDKAVGDPESTAARYTAYSMYELWRSGVSLVVWFLVRDIPGPVNSPSLVGGGGLYTSSGTPKLMLSGFDFPVVAGVSGGRGFVWGRAPVSRRSEVLVQRATGRRWIQVAKARTGADGVFMVRFPARGNGRYRARVVHGPTSVAYYSAPIPAQRTHT